MEQENKKLKVGVFVDEANLYYGAKQHEWEVDLIKFRNLLATLFNVCFVNFYVAMPDKSDISYQHTARYLALWGDTVTIKTKPLKYITEGGHIIKKGNVDLEIALDVVRTVDELDIIIIVSGDSDFVALRDYVFNEKHKRTLFMSYRGTLAYELKLGKYLHFEKLRLWIEANKNNTPGFDPGRTSESSIEVLLALSRKDFHRH